MNTTQMIFPTLRCVGWRDIDSVSFCALLKKIREMAWELQRKQVDDRNVFHQMLHISTALMS